MWGNYLNIFILNINYMSLMDIINDKNLNLNIEREVNTICQPDKTKKNILVLAGGGMKGLYILGCLKYLEEKNLLKYINTYAGTSVGGHIAFMLSIGYTVNEIYKFTKCFDFTRLTDLNISNIFSKFSVSSHEGLDKAILYQLNFKNIKHDITLLELYKKTKKKLILATVCINTREVEYLSYETYPELLLITALKMTTAVPILFPFVEYNNKKYIDGGLLENFPITIFDKELDNVIGINLMSELPVAHSNLMEYILLVLGIIYFNGFNKYNNEKYKDCVLNINISENNTFNFEINSDKKKNMYREGYNYIKKNCKFL
jgi:NTE family protein